MGITGLVYSFDPQVYLHTVLLCLASNIRAVSLLLYKINEIRMPLMVALKLLHALLSAISIQMPFIKNIIDTDYHASIIQGRHILIAYQDTYVGSKGLSCVSGQRG